MRSNVHRYTSFRGQWQGRMHPAFPGLASLGGRVACFMSNHCLFTTCPAGQALSAGGWIFSQWLDATRQGRVCIVKFILCLLICNSMDRIRRTWFRAPWKTCSCSTLLNYSIWTHPERSSRHDPRVMQLSARLIVGNRESGPAATAAAVAAAAAAVCCWLYSLHPSIGLWEMYIF